MGESGPRHLRDLLDGGPVPASAALRLSSGIDPRLGRGPRLDRARGTGALDHPWAGDDRSLDFGADARLSRGRVGPELVPREARAGHRFDRLSGLAWRLRQEAREGRA